VLTSNVRDEIYSYCGVEQGKLSAAARIHRVRTKEANYMLKPEAKKFRGGGFRIMIKVTSLKATGIVNPVSITKFEVTWISSE
jgi:hypothetical protein